MPILSAFYGIIIRMYYFDDKEHHEPHIHAECSGEFAVFSIATGNVIVGTFPSSKERLVQAWIEIHRGELFSNWSLATSGQKIFKVDPLT